MTFKEWTFHILLSPLRCWIQRREQWRRRINEKLYPKKTHGNFQFILHFKGFLTSLSEREQFLDDGKLQ